MNKKIFFLLAAAIALLMSCSDSVKQDTNVETDAKLYVSVQDGSNGNPLDAKVTLRSTGESKDAKVSSPAIFKAYTGRHALEVVSKLPGYAPALVEAGIKQSCNEVEVGSGEYDCVNPGTHIALNTNKTVKLYPTTASLTGKLVYKDTKGQEVVAAGVTVRLAVYPELELLNPVFYATTEADGSYKFENLPAVGTEYKIDVLPSTTAGTTFGEYKVCSKNSTACRPLLSNGKADYGRQSLSEKTSTNSVGHLVDFDQRVNPNQPIVFTFNDVINQKLLDRSTLLIPGTQAYSVKWEGKTLTLTPAAEWEAGELQVCFNNLKFETNKKVDASATDLVYESCYYNRGYYLDPYYLDHCTSDNPGNPPTNYYHTNWTSDNTDEPRPGNPSLYIVIDDSDFSACKTVAINATDISALTVDFVVLDTANALFGEPLDLRWSPVAGATGYELYVALKGAEKYTEITGLPTEPDDMGNLDYSYTLTSTVLNALGTYKGGTVVFKIRAFNDKSKTAFAVFEVKDKAEITPCTGATPGAKACKDYCTGTGAGVGKPACENECQVYGLNSTQCTTYCGENSIVSSANDMCFEKICGSETYDDSYFPPNTYEAKAKTSTCKAFCQLPGRGAIWGCVNNWACEMTGTDPFGQTLGIDGGSCEYNQCGFWSGYGYNLTNKCYENNQTCDWFNWTSSECNYYCRISTSNYINSSACMSEYNYCSLFSSDPLCTDNSSTGGSDCSSDLTISGCLCTVYPGAKECP